MFADIVITKKAHELDRLFCYKVPEELESLVSPGKRVIVPFGTSGKTEGIIVNVYTEEPGFPKIKYIYELIDNNPVVTKTGFKIADFIRKKYLATYFDALKLNMPSGMKTLIDEKVYLKDTDADNLPDKQQKIADILFKYNGCSVKDLSEKLKFKDLKAQLTSMEESGVVELKSLHTEAVKDKTTKIITLIADREEVLSYIEANSRKKAQIRILNTLLSNKSMTLSDLRSFANVTSDSLNAIVSMGFAEIEEIEVLRNPYENRTFSREEKLSPTEEQKEAIDTILKNEKDIFLLHGITGSGKTEVYLQVIEQIIENGKNAIVLVPEISLTPQMVNRFFRRFGNTVAVIHSGLSKEERYDQFKMISRGKIRVVIGARSAIFAPIENVGIIIIDEEHESSYKSDVHPKYDTVEVAKERAKIENSKLILASATPSIVSYYNAKCGNYKLISLKNRTNNLSTPDIFVVDMREELRNGNISPISSFLKNELQERIDRKEQSVLFINRRGYSTFISCRNCGYVAKCPNCDVSLTYHNNKDKLICHYCGYERAFFTECPDCKSKHIKHFGKGTQKIEDGLKNEFPDISVIRMDADTTYKKFSHEKILTKFEKENINVLLGTQMITKGLDFKNVTLSAVLAADGGLYLDDYRSCERTFSQITQVVGRAGRGDKKGIGVIQTYSPDHYVIRLAKEGNYEEFYNSEINLRKEMNFPPFCDIINIICQSENLELGKKLIKESYNMLVNYKRNLNLNDDELKIYRPNYAPVPKIKNRYRLRILIKAKSGDNINHILESLYVNYNKNYKVKDIGLSVDINPVNML